MVDIAQAKAMMGHRVALMGNIPPLDVGVRESPEVVSEWSKACLDKAAPGGGMILSVGGGVSPDMPAENIDAMVEAARTWIKPSPDQIKASRQEATAKNAETGSGDRGARRRRRPRPR